MIFKRSFLFLLRLRTTGPVAPRIRPFTPSTPPPPPPSLYLGATLVFPFFCSTVKCIVNFFFLYRGRDRSTRKMEKCACDFSLGILSQPTAGSLETRQASILESNTVKLYKKLWDSSNYSRARAMYFVLVRVPGYCLQPTCTGSSTGMEEAAPVFQLVIF